MYVLAIWSFILLALKFQRVEISIFCVEQSTYSSRLNATHIYKYPIRKYLYWLVSGHRQLFVCIFSGINITAALAILYYQLKILITHFDCLFI